MIACANPKCAYHIEIRAPDSTPYFQVIEDNEVLRIERHRLVRRNGTQIFFCEVCTKAISMCNGS